MATDDPTDPEKEAKAKEREELQKISEEARRVIEQNNRLLTDQLGKLKEIAEQRRLMNTQEEQALDRINELKEYGANVSFNEQMELDGLLEEQDKRKQDLIDKQTEFNKLLAEANEKLSENKTLGLDMGKVSEGNIESMTESVGEMSAKFEDADKSGATVQKVMEKMSRFGTGFLGDAIKSVQGFAGGIGELKKQYQLAGGPGKLFTNSVTQLGGKLGYARGMLLLTGGAVFALGGLLLKMALNVDNTAKAFGSATGFGSGFQNQLHDIHRTTLSAGGSLQDASEALTALTNNFSQFRPDARGTNTELASTIVNLKKIGVDGAAAAKTMDHFVRSLGMSAESASDLTVEIAMMGKQMGVTSAKMISDFQAVAGNLAIYGTRSIQVFKDLAAQAKASGMEVSTLVGLAEQFNTFDKAADSAAKLNAVLGTQISTLAMMNMDYDDRISYLRQEIQIQVGNFNDLDQYTKMYIAQAMGLKDVDEAQRMLNMSSAEYTKYKGDMEAQAKTQEDLADLAKELVPIMQKMKIVFSQLAIALTPLIKGFLGMIGVLSFILTPLADFINFLGTLTDSSIPGFIVSVSLLTYAFYALAAAELAAMWPLIPILAIFGALYDAIHKPGSPEFWEMFAIIGLGLLALGAAAALAGPSLLALGGAILLIGAGVAIIFHALEGLVATLGGDEGFGNLGAGFISLAEGINAVGVAMASLKVSDIMKLMALKTLAGDGFIAVKTDGTATTMVVGGDDIAAKMSGGNITVDVKMPEMKSPEVNVKVYLDSRELRTIIKDVYVNS